jgi:4'-phosphopantetheinyl transferase
MSLASALLKRLFVHKSLAIPWSEVRYGRKKDSKHGKPCALLPLPLHGPAPIEFNVSHQAGLVALVGCKTSDLDAELGVDIVCVNERNESKMIQEEGFEAWIDMYAEIFSAEEAFDMKYNATPFPLLDGTLVTPELLGRQDRCCKPGQQLSVTLPSGETRSFYSDLLIEAKLRRFFTFWCYKEAYIKLDGEALLATWIPRLEFKHVRAPSPGTPARCSTHGVWGERVSDAEVWFEHKRMDECRVEIQAFEENFMIGVAAKERLWASGPEGLPEVLTQFQALHLEEDVLSVAREGLVGET